MKKLNGGTNLKCGAGIEISRWPPDKGDLNCDARYGFLCNILMGFNHFGNNSGLRISCAAQCRPLTIKCGNMIFIRILQTTYLRF